MLQKFIGCARIDIVDNQYFVLDVEIELARKETSEVLMNKEIEAIAGHIGIQMFLQQGTGSVAFGWTQGKNSRKLSRYGIFDCLISSFDKSLLLGRLRVQFVGEVYMQRIADNFDRRLLAQRKTTLHIVLGHIVVLLSGSLTQGKLAEFIAIDSKTVVAEILGRLDIILVGIGPIQFHLLALVGYGIYILLVAALGDEISTIVIAAKEYGKMRIHFVFQLLTIAASSYTFLKLFYFGSIVGVHARRRQCSNQLR